MWNKKNTSDATYKRKTDSDEVDKYIVTKGVREGQQIRSKGLTDTNDYT